MKVAVINYSGSVGKTLISSYLLAPRLTGAKFYAVETINQSASDLGIENVTSFKGDDFSGEPAEFGKNRTLRFSGHP
ncbi:plasmid stabilization protein [Escherichia coli]|nr:plasmid stabilization protein [Escherichia coli]